MSPKRPFLTRKRSDWAASRAYTGVMRGGKLSLPAGVEARYAAALVKLANNMTKTVRREIEELFGHPHVQAHFATDISPISQARILTNELRSRFEQLFGTQAKDTAEQMADQTDRASATATTQSLKELSGGLSIDTKAITPPMREYLKGVVAENVALIKSIPTEYMMKVQGAVIRSITSGRGLEDLVPFFEQQEGITKRRAENIALDQTRKAYNGLNKGRMQAVGVKSYEWIHSGGSLHPRQRHIEMHGNVYRFDDPPVIEDDGTRGIPGQAINCKCTMRPIVKFDEGELAA